MKKRSQLLRLLAAALCVALLTLCLAACGGDNNSSSTTSAPESTQPEQSTGSTPSDADKEDGDVDAQPTGAELPLTEDKVTLRFWFQITAAARGSMADYNDNDYYQWLEEQTNVHIDWIMPVEGTEAESFNLLFASDDLPDMVDNVIDIGLVYPYGPDVAISDGVWLRLNEYEDLMPNYMAIINSNAQLQKDTLTDEGNRWSFAYLYEGGRKGNQGPAIRQDFLDAVDMDVPVTYDDWHEVLTAFKEQLGIEIPLFYSCSDNDGTTQNSEFLAGFGVGKDFYLDGKTVKFGPMEDGYGEYLEMMQQWYAEGLIDQSFTTRNGVLDDDLILNDKVGAVGSINNTYCGDTYYPSRGATNQDFNLVGASIPVKAEGDVTHLRSYDRLLNGYQIAISANTEYPELCVRWLDYQYSEEPSLIANYGNREGESYIVLDDGTYKWGELITANPDGLTQNQARGKFTTMNAPYENYNRVMGAWTETQLDAQKLWCKSTSLDDGVISTSVTMSEAEQEEYSSIMGDITTYVAEYTVNTIMGQSTVSFDDFRAQLTKMGIERAIELKQAGVDRYNER